MDLVLRRVIVIKIKYKSFFIIGVFDKKLQQILKAVKISNKEVITIFIVIMSAMLMFVPNKTLS